MNKIFYALCPAHVQTGGTELLHQFVDCVNNSSQEAYIVYYDTNDSFVDVTIPDRFLKYNIKTATKIVDSIDVVLVLPEISFYFAKQFNNVRFLFWWLSYDNYFPTSSLFDYVKFYLEGNIPFRSLLSRFYHFNSSRIFSFRDILKINDRIIHGYQSQYVHHKLFREKIFNQLPLSDYINTTFFQNEEKALKNRENIILYNPAKGIEVTNRIISKISDYEFVPLKGLTAEQVADLFSKAKLYIDFGNHPGKDRMPREAVLQGCVILVGWRGSAKYLEDVLIPSDKKISIKDHGRIIREIETVMKNYEREYLKLVLYKESLKKERDNFVNEVKNIVSAFSSLL